MQQGMICGGYTGWQRFVRRRKEATHCPWTEAQADRPALQAVLATVLSTTQEEENAGVEILLEGPCECNPFDFHQTGNLGVCMADVFDDSTFCYVSLESRCADKQPSKFFPSFHWSLAACAPRNSLPTSSSNSLVEGQQGEGLVVEMHGLWNFTSTFTECRNYCSLAERCKSMYTHYDNELQLCHLSTRPFYAASYSHVHSMAQPRRTHLIQDEDVERLW